MRWRVMDPAKLTRQTYASHQKDALAAIAGHRYTDADKIYDEMGSKPLAAQPHLLASQQFSGQRAQRKLPPTRNSPPASTSRSVPSRTPEEAHLPSAGER